MVLQFLGTLEKQILCALFKEKKGQPPVSELTIAQVVNKPVSGQTIAFTSLLLLGDGSFKLIITYFST